MSTFELAFSWASVDQVAGQLLWTTGKVTVVLIVAALILRCLRSATADTRHAIWMVAFGTALLVPVMEAFGPRLHLLPAAPAVVVDAQEVAKAPLPPDLGALDTRSTTAQREPAQVAGRVAQREAQGRRKTWQGLRWSTVLVSVWGIGLGWLSIRLFAGIVSVARLRKNTDPAGAMWDEPRATAQRLSRVRNAPELRIARNNGVPMLVGLWHRMVILPRDAEGWTTPRKVAVLHHEFAHLRRFDLETGLLAQLLCMLHWLNPLVWPARRQMLFERERACDDAVLASGVSPTDYASQILEVARSANRTWEQPATAAMASMPELEERLHSILDRDRSRKDASPYERVGVMMLALLIGTPIASLSLTAPPAVAAMPVVTSSEWASEDVPDTLEGLAALVDHPEDRMRVLAVKALSGYRDPATVDVLDAFADDPDPLVREWTARSLAMIGRSAGADTLLYLLDDEEPDVREWAIRSFASVSDDRAVDALTDALDDEVPDVREWAIRTLMAYGDPATIDALADTMLNDGEPDVREWAARGLGALGDPAAIAALEEAAFDEVPDVREWAVRSLGEVDDPASVDALIDIMYDGYPDLQKWAARGLGKQSDNAGDNVLLDVVASEAFELDARTEAARVLGDMQRVDALDALQSALDSQADAVRAAADKAIETRDATRDPNDMVDQPDDEQPVDPRPEVATEGMDPWMALAMQYVNKFGIDEDDARRLADQAIGKRDDFLRRYGNRDAERGAEWIEQLRERYLIGNLERMRARQR